MENHVPTLETCKRLKTARFPQDVPYGWYPVPDTEPMVAHEDWAGEVGALSEKLCAAPIFTEILELLPREFSLVDHDYLLDLGSGIDHKSWVMRYQNPLSDGQYHAAEHENPTEAAALLWLKLNAK